MNAQSATDNILRLLGDDPATVSPAVKTSLCTLLIDFANEYIREVLPFSDEQLAELEEVES